MLEVTLACVAIYTLYKVQILMARVDDVLQEEASKNKPPEHK
jgi:hypothetical protein